VFANLISDLWPLLFRRPDTASGLYRRPADGRVFCFGLTAALRVSGLSKTIFCKER
jgi:hypothetical protein